MTGTWRGGAGVAVAGKQAEEWWTRALNKEMEVGFNYILIVYGS